MPVQQDLSCLQQRRIMRIEYMAMGREHGLSADFQKTVLCQDWKFQDHLVHLRVAVPPYAKQLLLYTVEHGDDILRSIFLRKIVARSVIQNVS